MPAVLRFVDIGVPDVSAGKHRVECGGRLGHPRRGNPLILQGRSAWQHSDPGIAGRTARGADYIGERAHPVRRRRLGAGEVELGLAVGPRRPDGFHPIDTIFCALDLYDRITAEPAEQLSLSLDGPEAASVPADERNLAWRAAELLAEHAGRPPAVALRIDKRIPVAAGLAGGSADAAGALLGCDRLWQLATPPSGCGSWRPGWAATSASLSPAASRAAGAGGTVGPTGRADAALGAGSRHRRAVHRCGLRRIDRQQPSAPEPH